MDCVRVAIVGMGIGKQNARGFLRHPRARVVALCDLLEPRMHEFAKELPEPVTLYTDFQALCRDPQVDAIFVGTPNQHHVPVALAALRAGKHVMVTKPLADSLAAARELVEVAEASGLVNMMSLSTRFSDGVGYLGGLCADGTLGEVYYARARSVRRSGIPNWSLGFIEEGGGAFRDMGVHVLDSAWWLMGMPRPVSVLGVAGARFGPLGQGYWRFAPPPPEEFYRRFAADDYGGGFIRFANGAGLQIESFWASHQPDELQIELFGSDGGARLRPLTLYRTQHGAPQDISVALPKGPEPWDLIAAHFVECILDGVPCRAPLRHGLLVQEMMEALLESAAAGREVRLDGSDL
jgi:predicted dehydrogenase